MGTLVSISGALVVTLYKGPPIGSLPVQSPSVSSEDSFPSQSSLFNMLATESNWILGGLFLAIACLSLSICNISQVILKQQRYIPRKVPNFKLADRINSCCEPHDRNDESRFIMSVIHIALLLHPKLIFVKFLVVNYISYIRKHGSFVPKTLCCGCPKLPVHHTLWWSLKLKSIEYNRAKLMVC